jgi:hypothetical protein
MSSTPLGDPPSHDATTVTVRVAMARVVKWLYAMSTQAERIRSAPDGAMPTLQVETDLHFFLIALSNFLRAVDLVAGVAAPSAVQKIKADVSTFHRDVPGSTDLRNVLEHYDSYLMGDGFLQMAARRRPTSRSGAGDPALSFVSRRPDQPTITVIVPGVDDFSVTVESALDAAHRLVSVVDHALDEAPEG